jgi:hypothetical protein
VGEGGTDEGEEERRRFQTNMTFNTTHVPLRVNSVNGRPSNEGDDRQNEPCDDGDGDAYYSRMGERYLTDVLETMGSTSAEVPGRLVPADAQG